MEFLYSNYMPLKVGSSTFVDKFFDAMVDAKQLDIAVGYITADSLIELQKIVELNNLQRLNLIIGMHYFEKFTKPEYRAAMTLNSFLKQSGCGAVKLVTPFKYHGKIYTYSKNNKPVSGIIGSNNLSSIIGSNSRTYEASVYIQEPDAVKSMYSFVTELSLKASDDIDVLDIQEFKERNPLLEGHEHVEKIVDVELEHVKNSIIENVSFDIPIKGAEQCAKSNLNVYFGEGRKSPNGIIKPRHWYEVEIIVPKAVTSQQGYPKADTDEAIFDVVTDDGWKFKCKISGTNSKNFRSENDLKILGKWIKGRLENEGVLRIGEPVTQQTIIDYGRDNLKLTKTTIPNTWYLDFGVR